MVTNGASTRRWPIFPRTVTPSRLTLLAGGKMKALLLTTILMAAAGMAQEKSNDRRIDYIEFHASDLARTKAFYTAAFGWKFTDYGPTYTSFDDGRLTGGFWTEAAPGRGPLIIL